MGDDRLRLPIFPDGGARVLALRPLDGAQLEPLGESIGWYTTPALLAQPCPNRGGTHALDEPGPLFDVTVGEHLIEDEIEILIQGQRIERRRGVSISSASFVRTIS